MIANQPSRLFLTQPDPQLLRPLDKGGNHSHEPREKRFQEPSIRSGTVDSLGALVKQIKDGFKVTGTASVSRGIYSLDLKLTNKTSSSLQLSRTMVLLDSTRNGEACFGYGWYDEAEDGMGTMAAPLDNWAKSGRPFGAIASGESKNLSIWGKNTFIFQISPDDRAYVTAALPEVTVEDATTGTRFRPVVHFRKNVGGALAGSWSVDSLEIVPLNVRALAELVNSAKTHPTLRLLACLWLVEIDPQAAKNALEAADEYLPKKPLVRGYIDQAFKGLE